MRHIKSIAVVCATASFSAANANLLTNGDFSAGSTVNVVSTSLFPGPCAADNWEVFHNVANTTTVTRIVSPPMGLPTGATTALYFNTDNIGSEVAQTFNTFNHGPATATGSVWVYVLKGTAGMGFGNGGNTGYLATSTIHEHWQKLSATFGGPDNEFIIGNAGSGGAVFYMANAEISARPVPEPATMAALGVGVLGLIRRRRAQK